MRDLASSVISLAVCSSSARVSISTLAPALKRSRARPASVMPGRCRGKFDLVDERTDPVPALHDRPREPRCLDRDPRAGLGGPRRRRRTSRTRRPGRHTRWSVPPSRARCPQEHPAVDRDDRAGASCQLRAAAAGPVDHAAEIAAPSIEAVAVLGQPPVQRPVPAGRRLDREHDLRDAWRAGEPDRERMTVLGLELEDLRPGELGPAEVAGVAFAAHPDPVRRGHGDDERHLEIPTHPSRRAVA
jgi:hypothetical protein